jgi:hypothetical protein
VVSRLEDAEIAVRNAFLDEFPEQNFRLWNTDISDSWAQDEIRNGGRATPINIRLFIERLS